MKRRTLPMLFSLLFSLLCLLAYSAAAETFPAQKIVREEVSVLLTAERSGTGAKEKTILSCLVKGMPEECGLPRFTCDAYVSPLGGTDGDIAGLSASVSCWLTDGSAGISLPSACFSVLRPYAVIGEKRYTFEPIVLREESPLKVETRIGQTMLRRGDPVTVQYAVDSPLSVSQVALSLSPDSKGNSPEAVSEETRGTLSVRAERNADSSVNPQFRISFANGLTIVRDLPRLDIVRARAPFIRLTADQEEGTAGGEMSFHYKIEGMKPDSIYAEWNVIDEGRRLERVDELTESEGVLSLRALAGEYASVTLNACVKDSVCCVSSDWLPILGGKGKTPRADFDYTGESLPAGVPARVGYEVTGGSGNLSVSAMLWEHCGNSMAMTGSRDAETKGAVEWTPDASCYGGAHIGLSITDNETGLALLQESRLIRYEERGTPSLMPEEREKQIRNLRACRSFLGTLNLASYYEDTEEYGTDWYTLPLPAGGDGGACYEAGNIPAILRLHGVEVRMYTTAAVAWEDRRVLLMQLADGDTYAVDLLTENLPAGITTGEALSAAQTEALTDLILNGPAEPDFGSEQAFPAGGKEGAVSPPDGGESGDAPPAEETETGEGTAEGLLAEETLRRRNLTATLTAERTGTGADEVTTLRVRALGIPEESGAKAVFECSAYTSPLAVTRHWENDWQAVSMQDQCGLTEGEATISIPSALLCVIQPSVMIGKETMRFSPVTLREESPLSVAVYQGRTLARREDGLKVRYKIESPVPVRLVRLLYEKEYTDVPVPDNDGSVSGVFTPDIAGEPERITPRLRIEFENGCVLNKEMRRVKIAEKGEAFIALTPDHEELCVGDDITFHYKVENGTADSLSAIWEILDEGRVFTRDETLKGNEGTVTFHGLTGECVSLIIGAEIGEQHVSVSSGYLPVRGGKGGMPKAEFDYPGESVPLGSGVSIGYRVTGGSGDYSVDARLWRMRGEGVALVYDEPSEPAGELTWENGSDYFNGGYINLWIWDNVLNMGCLEMSQVVRTSGVTNNLSKSERAEQTERLHAAREYYGSTAFTTYYEGIEAYGKDWYRIPEAEIYDRPGRFEELADAIETLRDAGMEITEYTTGIEPNRGVFSLLMRLSDGDTYFLPVWAGENPESASGGATVADTQIKKLSRIVLGRDGSTVTIRGGGRAFVRKKPERSAELVGYAKGGEAYFLLDTAENGWMKIALPDGSEGWISPHMAGEISQ